MIPANDNEPLAAEAYWRKREMRPSPEEMQVAWQGVEFEERTDPILVDGQRAMRTRSVPIGGDMERGAERRCKRPRKGTWAPVVRLGKLEFSGEDFHKRKKQFHPLGSLVRCSGSEPEERLAAAHQAGIPMEDVKASNRYIAEVLSCEVPRHIPGKRKKRRARADAAPISTTGMTFAEARAFYGLPPVERDPRPVLPAASRDIAGQFVGLHVRGPGSPPLSMPDVSTPVHDAVEGADSLSRLMAALSPDDIKALDAAIVAANFTEVGVAFGFEGKRAERRGKSIAIEAAKKLEDALQKIAA